MSSEGPAVLVVDDNEDNRYTLTRRLGRLGYENVTDQSMGARHWTRLRRTISTWSCSTS